MPKALHRKFKRQATKHPEWSEERKNAYIYGTLDKVEKRRRKKKK